ncbi:MULTISPECIES: SDR family oxidoreductase [unclassified Bosea (in: a-proteobacteria)]|uniref:SDR family oxidoreductase n=1 Tax=unclassified Bosea (in: a-proteobacteria) TaxID=2653178 RepID=UPI000F762D91|nr:MULTISPECIES: SDR family oxidoreductase [unclassified Bosea (in: a-proteobacteria)]AZO79735.1 short-chain dehydrogenase [Bosea sp. Tri-49]RXT16012.1 short-chain dehydrogenase [Bosea sp. Tri-39]RXT39704.1 short-chain dehydrogenase [Bosea sp. Tri-54]
MMALKDKVAIVTGASSGIGRAAAKLFAAEGARLVITARRQSELDTLIGEIKAEGGEVIAVAGDIREEALAQRLVETATERFGGLDIAFNNAGTVGDLGPVAEMSLATWHQLIETNLTSAFLGAKYQAPALETRGGGSLIFTASFVGYTAGLAGMSAYAASKAGQIGLVKALAAELGGKRIRVNALLPGGTDTPASITNDPTSGPEVTAFVEGIHALKRMAQPEEIARAALFLASDASSFVTGTAFLADGGVSIQRG